MGGLVAGAAAGQQHDLVGIFGGASAIEDFVSATQVSPCLTFSILSRAHLLFSAAMRLKDGSLSIQLRKVRWTGLSTPLMKLFPVYCLSYADHPRRSLDVRAYLES